MRKKYMLNTGTGTLHIVGYCCHTKGSHLDKVFFETEQEAYNYAGKQIKFCKICDKVKEQKLEEADI